MVAGERLGVPPLDRFLSEIPAHSALLLLNDPGVEVDPFLYQAAHTHLEAGGTVVYVVLNRTMSSVLKSMHDHGFDVERHADDVWFVDGFSSLLGVTEGAPYALTDLKDPDKFRVLLELVAEDHPDALLLVDALSTLVDQAGFEPVRAAMPGLLGAMRRFRLAAAILTQWPYEDPIERLTEGFDAVVRLRAVEERVVMSQFFTVERAAWGGVTGHKPVLYKALRPGGIHAYVPKILVTGPFHCGKSTFVQSASGTATSVNRFGTTVALDHGRVTQEGLSVELFGTPGQERFDPLLKTIAGQALGVIVLVDSTHPETFPRAKEMMDLTWTQGLPLIVVANKQDLPGALDPNEVRALLGTPPGVSVVACSATDRASCRAVLNLLVDQILGVTVAR